MWVRACIVSTGVYVGACVRACVRACACVCVCVCVWVVSELYKCTQDSLSVSAGSKVEGQIYIPVVNWLLGLLTLACVLIFRSNTAIGNGFGEQSPNFPFTALCLISVGCESVQELGSHGMCCCNVSWLDVCTLETTLVIHRGAVQGCLYIFDIRICVRMPSQIGWTFCHM